MTAAATFDDSPELGGFDEASREIVNIAIRDGWTARRSKRGHMIMRAPDGKTTTSISRDLGSKRRERDNAWAPIRRYQKQAGIVDGAGPPPEEFKCPQCEFMSTDRRSLNGHTVSNHGPTQVCEYGCGRSFHTKASYALHVKSHRRRIEAERLAFELAQNPPPVEVPEVADLVEAEEPPVEAELPVEPEPVAVDIVPEAAPEVAPAESESPVVVGVKDMDTETLTRRITESLAATAQLQSILESVREVPTLIDELVRRHGEMEASLSLMGELFDSIRGK